MPLETYTNGDNDQPTTCPRDGARTEIIEEMIWDEDNWRQKHRCLDRSCRHTFVLESGDGL